MCWDLKDGERSLRRAKSGETLVEASSDTDAQIVVTLGFGAKDKPKPSHSWVLSAVSLRDSWS